jgi:ribosomal protein S18 acetylase RimI-like enzyme
MKIKLAKKSDLNRIMKMYKSCVEGMIKNGIDQWDHSYPNSEIIQEDIKNETYFICDMGGEIVGGINIDQKQDPTYLDIDWKDTSDSFFVVHRLGVMQEFWNKKIGKDLMLFTEKLVIEKKLKSIRLDTYSGNPKAMEFYRRLGYNELGTIDLKPNKNKYHCFEKNIIK